MNRKKQSKQTEPTDKTKKEKNNQDDDNDHRIAMRQFLKQSKNLRFGEKMNNVNNWRKNQIKYAIENKNQVEDPASANDMIQYKRQKQFHVESNAKPAYAAYGSSRGEKTDEEEDFVSLPRSISLSNNRSRESFDINDQTPDSNNQTNLPYKFIPIVLMCCPNIVKGKNCGCGFNTYYPANELYKHQFP